MHRSFAQLIAPLILFLAANLCAQATIIVAPDHAAFLYPKKSSHDQ